MFHNKGSNSIAMLGKVKLKNKMLGKNIQRAIMYISHKCYFLLQIYIYSELVYIVEQAFGFSSLNIL